MGEKLLTKLDLIQRTVPVAQAYFRALGERHSCLNFVSQRKCLLKLKELITKSDGYNFYPKKSLMNLQIVNTQTDIQKSLI